MKRIYSTLAFIFIAATTLSLLSCSKSETNSLSVPAKGIIVTKPGDSGTTTFDSSNITSIYPTSIPEGWTVDEINMYEGTITVTSPDLPYEEDEVQNGTLSLMGYTPTGNTRTISIYLAIVESTVDFYDQPANCYVVTKPDTRYTFNPMIGGSATPVATTKVRVLWETKSGLIQYLDMRDGKATFYIAGAKENEDDEEVGVYPGNAVIGGYDQNDNLLWSWHIWVTNNDPTTAENTIVLNGQTVMSANLGAECNSNGSTDSEKIFDSFGLYYQWGRKDPFVGPATYDFSGNYDHTLTDYRDVIVAIDYVDSTADEGTSEWTTENPMSIIKGNKENGYDWLYSGHDNTLWSTTTKSESDPCPAGWRVPDASIYSNLTINDIYDNIDWSELQPMYGILLNDITSGEEYFFTAQGRRNYLDCRLDIINDDEFCPVPWSGYYWTATTEGEDASAMFFDLNTATRTWNGFDAKRAMHRANALPIRCVRE